MKKETKNWLDSAKYDMETAEHMFNTGRYIYTIFMCHLAVEKALKAKEAFQWIEQSIKSR